MTRILYLAHDLDDAAIWRRVDMLRTGGAEVVLAGFRRESGDLPDDVVVLGTTRNARMIQRALSVMRQRFFLKSKFSEIPRPDAIMCRNLEMLVLAVPLQRQFFKSDVVPLIYEVLDIHRLMVGPSLTAKALRWLERSLCREVSALIVSSPAFLREHFDAYRQTVAPAMLLENKVPFLHEGQQRPPEGDVSKADGPITIGWFGILRCQYSLNALDRLTRARPGRYRVIMRGRPALDSLPEFHATVGTNPDLEFMGPYAYPVDLGVIYDGIDLAWSIDRYDAGANSDWLLPNRLYESGLHGVPPIALNGTEVSRRMRELGVGLTVDGSCDDALDAALGSLTGDVLKQLKEKHRAVLIETWAFTRDDARNLVETIRTLPIDDHTERTPAIPLTEGPAASTLVVIPALNEAGHIEVVLNSVLPFLKRQKQRQIASRVVVADGGSSDGTRDIAKRVITENPEFDIRLIPNPGKIQSVGVNLAGFEHGDGMDWLVRLDAHAAYPDDYIDTLLEEAHRTNADSVVVAMRAVGTGTMQKVIAMTQNSRLGNGGSAHRTGEGGRFVDHGHHALMRLNAFKSVRGYDESFSHNEDAELDLRLSQAGYRIWLTSLTRNDYFPRRTIAALAKQYFNFGKGRARTTLKHSIRPRLRQMAMIAVAPVAAISVLALLQPWLAIPAFVWFAACLTAGLGLAFSQRNLRGLAAGPVAAVMHAAWSLGFWTQLVTGSQSHARHILPDGEKDDEILDVDRIAVGVCTFRRPELIKTLETLEDQHLPANTVLSIIVVDNDTEPTARNLVECFAGTSKHTFIYRHAPARNISIARNAALEEAERRRFRVFAFIDDDELASVRWLKSLLTRLARTDTDVVVGPTYAVYPEAAPEWMQTFRVHDTRPELNEDGRPIAGHSCNVMMDLRCPGIAGRRFDLNRGVSGGEDTAFFKEAMEAGARLAFAPEARLEEPVTATRARLEWLLKRRFRMGQTHGSLLTKKDGDIASRIVNFPPALAKTLYCATLVLLTSPFAGPRNANLLRGALHVGTMASLLGFSHVSIYGQNSSSPQAPKSA